MAGRSILLWILRVIGIGVFTFAYVVFFAIMVTAGLGDLHRPNGQEPVPTQQDTETRNFQRHALDIMSWPVIEPFTRITRTLAPTIRHSAGFGVLQHLAFLANALVWGLGIWAIIELLSRGLLAVFGVRPRMT